MKTFLVVLAPKDGYRSNYPVLGVWVSAESKGLAIKICASTRIPAYKNPVAFEMGETLAPFHLN